MEGAFYVFFPHSVNSKKHRIVQKDSSGLLPGTTHLLCLVLYIFKENTLTTSKVQQIMVPEHRSMTFTTGLLTALVMQTQ